jgi:hypothetical protein
MSFTQVKFEVILWAAVLTLLSWNTCCIHFLFKVPLQLLLRPLLMEAATQQQVRWESVSAALLVAVMHR